jgi:hypothetical protein
MTKDNSKECKKFSQVGKFYEEIKNLKKKIEIIGGALYFALNFRKIFYFFFRSLRKSGQTLLGTSFSEPKTEKIPGSFGS